MGTLGRAGREGWVWEAKVWLETGLGMTFILAADQVAGT